MRARIRNAPDAEVVVWIPLTLRANRAGWAVAHNVTGNQVELYRVAGTVAMTVADFIQCDLACAPPFCPVWDPLLTAANQWFKKMQR